MCPLRNISQSSHWHKYFPAVELLCWCCCARSASNYGVALPNALKPAYCSDSTCLADDLKTLGLRIMLEVASGQPRHRTSVLKTNKPVAASAHGALACEFACILGCWACQIATPSHSSQTWLLNRGDFILLSGDRRSNRIPHDSSLHSFEQVR